MFHFYFANNFHNIFLEVEITENIGGSSCQSIIKIFFCKIQGKSQVACTCKPTIYLGCQRRCERVQYMIGWWMTIILWLRPHQIGMRILWSF